MFDRLFYREKGLFLQSFHPATVLVYLLVLLILSLIYDHPLYLLALFLLLALLIREVDGLDAWEGFLKAGVFLMLVVMMVNPLVIRAGKTIIWHGPAVPFLGKLDISMEAVYFGAASSLRLLVIISIFCLYNLMINPDRVLNLFSRVAGKSVLVMTLATRLFPTMVRDLQRIREVQQLRGVDFDTGNLWQRAKKYSGLYNVLLLSSLEGAMEIAESMQARAFGSGRRSVYSRNILRPRDHFCLGGSVLALLAAVWGLRYGYGRYSFYPEADFLIKDGTTLAVLFIVLFYLSVPLILSKGWKHCRFLKSKI
ncbi:energy-coupling factor transporter transmembrane component T [Desulfofundulus thermocisternus]|uniref:energy-coupling factor transporter transmembrane component T n=1 Tax=Desulfofundulus thermocisternus TaxID=42471 RepID=UPI001A0808BF|nr:energy-coupling factor transporter transmembrane component T [Desulfofundulus thermocisternus]MBE3586451.1 energy-coupling factor transporter transmembrane protein EcfT [Thermoanaerobacter sp.]MCS5696762.1 energy-coupling factor transporter transmembrane protein EcfT [Desulfofundulus thermocisternus]